MYASATVAIVSDGDLREAVAKLAARHGTILGQSAPIAVNDDDRIDQFAEEMVEVPPGFEPGVEVLQSHPRFPLALSWAAEFSPKSMSLN